MTSSCGFSWFSLRTLVILPLLLGGVVAFATGGLLKAVGLRAAVGHGVCMLLQCWLNDDEQN